MALAEAEGRLTPDDRNCTTTNYHEFYFDWAAIASATASGPAANRS